MQSWKENRTKNKTKSPKQKLNQHLDFIRDAERAAQKGVNWAESYKLENWRQQLKKHKKTKSKLWPLCRI